MIDKGNLIYKETNSILQIRRGYRRAYFGFVAGVLFLSFFILLTMALIISSHILTSTDWIAFLFGFCTFIVVIYIEYRDYSGIKKFSVYEKGVIHGARLTIGFSYKELSYIDYDLINGLTVNSSGKDKRVEIHLNSGYLIPLRKDHYNKRGFQALASALKKHGTLDDEAYSKMLNEINAMYS